MNKKAFITGITGQDGSYLAEFLIEKDYEVHAVLRRGSTFTTSRIEHLMGHPLLKLYHGDLTDSSNLHTLLSQICPDEVYNLAAQSHVAVSFEVPEYTAEVDGIGTIRLLNAIKDLKLKPKFYQASTSELFGGLPETAPQNEKTPFTPHSPYAAAKLYSYWITCNYRDSYGIFAVNGILFNHESPRRGETFVTKKITKAAARIKQGRQELVELGNLSAKRDWGYAKDYVECMWMMLQQERPEDFVIATGKSITIREFAQMAFKEVGLEILWQGEGINEIGIDQNGITRVKVNPKYFRPQEVEFLQGDASKAKEVLGWKPKTSLEQLVKIMVDFDLKYDDFRDEHK